MNLSRRLLASLGAFALVIILFATPTRANAAGVTYVWNQTATANWSVGADWTPTGPADGAGNIANYNSAVSTTTTLDSARTIGQLTLGAGATNQLWTIAVGSGAMTFDNTGGATNAFGNSNAAISVAAGVAGTRGIQFNPGVVIANTDLTIGSAAASSAGIVLGASVDAVTITNASPTVARNLVLVNNSNIAGAGITINDTIGAASGQGLINISNSGTGTQGVLLAGKLLATVGTITQNSATSSLSLSSGTAGAYSSGVNVLAGTLIYTNGGTVSNALGTGTLTIGATSGAVNTGITTNGGGSTNISFGNAINVQGGGTGSITMSDTQGTQTFNGLITLNSNSAVSNMPTLTFTNTNSSGTNIVVTAGVVGTGNLVLNATNVGQILLQTTSINNTGTITNSGGGVHRARSARTSAATSPALLRIVQPAS